MATVTIDVPDDALAALHHSPQELSQEIQLAPAMPWYTRGRISHEKFARVAGIGRMELIDALAAARLPAFHVELDELEQELACAQDADRERLALELPKSGSNP